MAIIVEPQGRNPMQGREWKNNSAAEARKQAENASAAESHLSLTSRPGTPATILLS